MIWTFVVFGVIIAAFFVSVVIVSRFITADITAMDVRIKALEFPAMPVFKAIRKRKRK